MCYLLSVLGMVLYKWHCFGTTIVTIFQHVYFSLTAHQIYYLATSRVLGRTRHALFFDLPVLHALWVFVETRKHRLVVILIVIFGCNKRRHGGPGRIGKELVPSVLECKSLWVSFGIISRKIKKGAHMGYFWYYKY